MLIGCSPERGFALIPGAAAFATATAAAAGLVRAATMRSPSFSAPAPVVMTRVPSLRPRVISMCSPSRMPT